MKGPKCNRKCRTEAHKTSSLIAEAAVINNSRWRENSEYKRYTPVRQRRPSTKHKRTNEQDGNIPGNKTQVKQIRPTRGAGKLGQQQEVKTTA